MYGRQYIWPVAVILTLAAEANWVYNWPYGAEGECRCKRLPITGFGHPNESSCLRAFSQEHSEYCWTPDPSASNSTGNNRLGGITEHDCAKYAVSIHPTMGNMDCESSCLKVVVGALSQAQFFQKCKFEIVASSRSRVAPLLSGCFVNYVLGHSDFDPNKGVGGWAPLRVFADVDSATKCQSLCQNIESCAWFQWRATPDDECNTSPGSSDTYQRAPKTCELYDFRYVEAVMSVDVNGFGHNPSAYADGVCDLRQWEDRGCDDLFRTDLWHPFAPQKCLSCDCDPKCVFTSQSHISGPAYCQKDILTDVCNVKPPFEHTTPTPECSTTECETQTECTTSECETHSETSTPTPTAVPRTRPGTQPTFTTIPRQTTSNGGSVETAGTTEVESTYTEISTTTELQTSMETSTPPPVSARTSTIPRPTGAPCKPCAECPQCPPGAEECVCPPCPYDDECLDANWDN